MKKKGSILAIAENGRRDKGMWCRDSGLCLWRRMKAKLGKSFKVEKVVVLQNNICSGTKSCCRVIVIIIYSRKQKAVKDKTPPCTAV